ncbi:MAG: MFS transporter [Pseudomonadota bacterium]
MFALIAKRRFGPLLGAIFLNAFNDNLYRTTLLFLITYRILATQPGEAAQLVALSAGLFVLPYVFFSGLAGQVADAVDKARAARTIKFCEILVMGAGITAITLESVPGMLAILFLMGLQSTFFGPVKYSLLPQHLRPEEVTGGTALVEMATFLAVLTGQIAAGLIAPQLAMAGIMVVAIGGWLLSLAIPPAPPAPGDHPVSWNIAASTVRVLAYVARVPALLWSAIGISWYWALGTVFTSLFIPLVKSQLGGTEPVATLFLAAFSIGMATGSLVIGKILAGTVTARTLAMSLVLMSLATLDLYFAVTSYVAPVGGLDGVQAFLARPAAWRVLIDLTVMAVGGGTLIVPLYTILQTRSAVAARARAIAGNNVLNTTAMVAAALTTQQLIGAGWREIDVLALFGGLNLVMILPMLALRRATAREDAAGPDLQEPV